MIRATRPDGWASVASNPKQMPIRSTRPDELETELAWSILRAQRANMPVDPRIAGAARKLVGRIAGATITVDFSDYHESVGLVSYPRCDDCADGFHALCDQFCRCRCNFTEEKHES